jgi:hypothetical protein
MEEVRDGLRPFVLGGLGMASTYRCLSERLAIAGPALRASFLPYYEQTAPYCLLLRPESRYGRGALNLAIETASIQVARLGCTGRQDFIVSVAG